MSGIQYIKPPDPLHCRTCGTQFQSATISNLTQSKFKNLTGLIMTDCTRKENIRHYSMNKMELQRALKDDFHAKYTKDKQEQDYFTSTAAIMWSKRLR